MFGLFASKIDCFRCNEKVKEKAAFFRRHMRFCGEACATAYAAEQPILPRDDGSPAANRQAVEVRLLATAGELNAALAAAGSSTALVFRGSAVDAALAGARLDDVQQCMHRLDAHVLEALPYMYTLGLKAEATRLECIDLEPIHGLSTVGAGPLQQKKIRELLEPIAVVVSDTLRALERP